MSDLSEHAGTLRPAAAGASSLTLVEKASILTETLPWLETYAGKIVVIKYGGNAMIDEDLKRAFAQDIVFMKRCGIHPVVVHGGGPQISSMLSRLGITSEFRGGLRVTSPEAMEVVRMVLVGQVGRDLVGLINSHSTLAVGLSGEDGGLFVAERRGTIVDGEEVDLGLVGDVIAVRTEAIAGLIASGSVPVVATIAPDVNGVVHNVNADTAAAALAVALQAERLVVLTDVEGLYRDWPASTEIIRELPASELRELMPTLESGMLPKMEACLRAVEGGLTRATVTDGRVPHALLLEIFTNAGIGTMVTQDGLIRLGSRVFSAAEGIPPHEYANGEFGWKGSMSTELITMSTELSSLAAQGSAALLDAYRESVMNTFGTPKRVFVRGEGCYVWDADGRRHLDLLSGLAVNALGHAHPTVLSAITGQIATLGHVSNFFATPAQVALASRLVAMSGADDARVFFTNSGTEANEAAFKITRATGRTKIISTEGAFHGRSMGALALTHNPKYREPFEPLPGEVIFVPYGDIGALSAAMADDVAAVVLEPIQGENGIVVPPADYLAGARQLCDQRDSLLWIDEVQTGIGRTGAWLAHRADGVRADVITVAKGLGNGFPIGACIAAGRAASLLGPGSHGSTFGGNPVAAIAGLAVIAVIERDGLLAHATAMGEYLASAITSLGHPKITGVRGRGLLRGVTLTEPTAAAIADTALDAGFIINAPRPDVLRLAPPLIITAAQLDGFVQALPTIISEAGAAG